MLCLVIRRRHRSISVLELRATAPSIPQLSNYDSHYLPAFYSFKHESCTSLQHTNCQSPIAPTTTANMKPVVSIMHAWSWYVLPISSPPPQHYQAPATRPCDLNTVANDMLQHCHLRLRHRDPLRPRRTVQRKPPQPNG
jgi:hypothetical protein